MNADRSRRPAVSYRAFEDRDVPGLLALWEAESGWGQLTEAQWRSWYVDSPYGPAIIAVAEDEHGAIAGQAMFARARVLVDGRIVPAVRLTAPILRADLRSAALRSRDHPVIGLYFAGIAMARDAGVEVVFAHPAETFRGAFRALQHSMPWSPVAQEFGPRVVERLECVERAADAVPVPMPSGMTVDVAVADHEFDDLWRCASHSLPVHCGVVRDATFLKFSNGRFRTYGTRSASGELVGYVSVDLKARLIVDCLAVSLHAMDQSIRAVTHAVLHESPGVLKAMETPALANVLKELEFVPHDFRFLMVCEWNDGASDVSRLALERWHLGVHD